MKRFTFAVRETFDAEVSVEAENLEEASRMVEEQYLNGDIVVSDFDEWSIEAVGTDLCDSEWDKTKDFDASRT